MIRNLFRRKTASGAKADFEAVLDKAFIDRSAGRLREAIEGFQKYLKFEPSNVGVLNSLGAAFSDIGNNDAAIDVFELAYTLDDTSLPSIVNYAKLLFEQGQTGESLQRLEWARLTDPLFHHTNTIYGAVCLKRGDVAKARKYQLMAWLADFDNLRLANCYVFYTAYDNIPEEMLAAEHRFWAETVAPVANVEISTGTSKYRKSGKKIRIGYWSPDFRNHSVRFFLRPLLENHDKDKFEVFLYHDSPMRDEETEKIEATGDRFFDVFGTSDEELSKLLIEHELDVLIELAGHSSANRINLLQNRLAKVQVTGLGYPPTTGLSSVDYKLLDKHLVTGSANQFYAEKPMVLPQSFWCFDPRTEIALAKELPVQKNGYITFGCSGNIAKITSPVLAMWREIMRRVPRSRIVVRSISLADPDAVKWFGDLVAKAGLPADRISLLAPIGGADFFATYNDLDIVLDTFPFNGGTTSCFAVYMGVPVITMAGESLISRMGASIMNNLGAGDLVATNAQEYIKKAVLLSQDISRLKEFKKSARAVASRTAMGNGMIFARDLESALEAAVRDVGNAVASADNAIQSLPVRELVRRAYAVQASGNLAAAERIVQHCLSVYPESGIAHVLATNMMTADRKFGEAADYLEMKLDQVFIEDKVSMLINIVRYRLLANQTVQAAEAAQQLLVSDHPDPVEKMQVDLIIDSLGLNAEPHSAPETTVPIIRRKVVCIVPCNKSSDFAKIEENIRQMAGSSLSALKIMRCDEHRKKVAYDEILNDESAEVIVFIQKNVKVIDEGFIGKILESLQSSDMVGLAGARHWNRLDWTLEPIETKAAGFLMPSAEKTGWLEIQLWGLGRQSVCGDMVVLDGMVMAFNRTALQSIAFDETLGGADTLMEQCWAHKAYRAGKKLAVHRHLGCVVSGDIALDKSNLPEARAYVVETFNFRIFEERPEDRMFISFPLPDAGSAFAAMGRFFTSSVNADI